MSKHGQKHELDRQQWTTCANFKFMHDNIGSEMVEAGLAKKMDEPVWMSKTGE